MKELIVGENGVSKRIDNYLFKLYGEKISKSEIYRYIRKKRIKINNTRTYPDYRLCLSDVIFLYINDDLLNQESKITSEKYRRQNLNPNIDIVYEDSNIIVIDKPAGLIVHPDKTQKFNTLIDNLKIYLSQRDENSKIIDDDGFSVAFCNRIDRNTSGLVVAAKNNATLLAMNRLIKNREITKKYRCLVYGKLEPNSSEIIKNYITKNTKNNTVIVTEEPINNSKYAETHYTVLETAKLKDKVDISLLEVELITGRTHQIRAHLSHIGHPIVGDSKYGSKKLNRKTGYKHQVLYSYQLQFHKNLSEHYLQYLSSKIITGKNASKLN